MQQEKLLFLYGFVYPHKENTKKVKEQPNLVPKVVFAKTFDGQKVQLGIFVVGAIESKAKTPLAFQRHKQCVFPVKLASVQVNLCANLATRVRF